MSFGCQLRLCREAESERFLGLVEIDVLLYEFKAASAAGVAKDVDRNANDWATTEVRRVATWLIYAILRFISLRSGVDNCREASIVGQLFT
jgi:hypothetical protein